MIMLSQEVTGNPRITEAEAAKLIALRIESTKTKNYGYYRVGALRSFGGGRKVIPHIEPKLQSVSIPLSLVAYSIVILPFSVGHSVQKDRSIFHFS